MRSAAPGLRRNRSTLGREAEAALKFLKIILRGLSGGNVGRLECFRGVREGRGRRKKDEEKFGS